MSIGTCVTDLHGHITGRITSTFEIDGIGMCVVSTQHCGIRVCAEKDLLEAYEYYCDGCNKETTS